MFATSDIYVSDLTFNRPPVADAGPDQNIYTGDTTNLNGSATDADGDAIPVWSWTVVDSPAGSVPQLTDADRPTAQFLPGTSGDYVLSLAVKDARGDFSAPDYVTVRARDNIPPVAVVTTDRTSGPAPLTVCFDGSGSYDPEGATPLTYYWEFLDGSPPASAATACHTFVNPGGYAATFTVTDARGATDGEVVTIDVQATNQSPVASPTATPATGPAPLAVQFVANASDPDGDALAYSWDFGDGGTSAASEPAHVYTAPGTFAVWLTVSDGQTPVSASLTVVVSPSIELSVTKADIDFKSRKSQLANVEIHAELYASIPGPDDVVALYVDGALVFAAPFDRFEPVAHHGTVVPGAYKLKAKHLWVLIDFTRGRLAVEAEKVLLTGYNPANGVGVEVMLGSAVAVDDIQPVDEKAERHYRHRRPERGRGNCYR